MNTPNDNLNTGMLKTETPETVEMLNMMGAPKKGSSLGPIVGLIVILAIIIMGSLYFWTQKSEKVTPSTLATDTSATETSTENNTATFTPDSQTQTLQTQSSSVDTTSIESDLNATDFQNIDSGVNQLQ